MDAFWVHLLLILVLLHRSMSAGKTTEEIGAVGGSVTFHIKNPSRDAVFWNFGSDPIATVLREDPPRAVFSKGKFEKRVSISEDGSALIISQLTTEDAGTYTAKISEETSTFILHVYRELEEPKVTCEAQNCSAGSCRFSLRCSTPGTDLGQVSYTWSRGDRPWDEGPTVLVGNESSWNELEPLTCTAQNLVSSRNVTVVAPGDLCAENAMHPPGLGPPSDSGVLIGAGVGIGVAVILLIFLFVFFWKSKGWRKFYPSQPKPADTEAKAEYSTVYAEVGPSQQHVPNGTKAKPTDGNSSSTIYSLVKRPEQAGDGTAENAIVTGLELV